MSIARAPRLVPSNDKKAHDLINRASNGTKAEASSKDVAVTVRVPEDILERIDARVKARRVRTPRHAWLLEAILDKLESEEK
ncbi:MAG TPA: hypothetical protein VHA06_10160 [Candidatus Angelobacter sp.]|jgi:predicted DNA binding CopG/RHH family protein|nr:hypothetical protein [Candidatus Angelobacter sp.]